MQETSMNANMTTFDLQRSIIDSTINVIYSVDGVTNRDDIAEWARTIPTTWFKKISIAIDESSDWGPSTEFDDICQDCGAPIKVEVPLNPLTFFL